MDAFVVYTNNVRPSAVTWLTGFTPYWSDALLLVQQDRRAGVRDRAVEARVGVDQDHRSGERDRQHAEARRADRRAAGERSADPARRRAGIRHAAGGPRRRPRRRRARGGMDRRHRAVRRPAPRPSTMPSAGCWRAPTRMRVRGAARGGSRQGEGCRHARGPGREARAARRRGRGLYRGRARSRCRHAGSTARRSRRRWRSVSRCAPRSPTRAAGSAARGRLRRTMPRREPMHGSTASCRSIEAGKPLAAQLAAKVKELPGATLQRWMAESCTGSYPLSVVASSRAPAESCAGERPVPGADRRADDRRRAVDRRGAADCRAARLCSQRICSAVIAGRAAQRRTRNPEPNWHRQP